MTVNPQLSKKDTSPMSSEAKTLFTICVLPKTASLEEVRNAQKALVEAAEKTAADAGYVIVQKQYSDAGKEVMADVLKHDPSLADQLRGLELFATCEPIGSAAIYTDDVLHKHLDS